LLLSTTSARVAGDAGPDGERLAPGTPEGLPLRRLLDPARLERINEQI